MFRGTKHFANDEKHFMKTISILDVGIQETMSTVLEGLRELAEEDFLLALLHRFTVTDIIFHRESCILI